MDYDIVAADSAILNDCDTDCDTVVSDCFMVVHNHGRYLVEQYRVYDTSARFVKRETVPRNWVWV